VLDRRDPGRRPRHLVRPRQDRGPPRCRRSLHRGSETSPIAKVREQLPAVLDIALDRMAELGVDGREVRTTNRVHHRSWRSAHASILSVCRCCPIADWRSSRGRRSGPCPRITQETGCRTCRICMAACHRVQPAQRMWSRASGANGWFAAYKAEVAGSRPAAPTRKWLVSGHASARLDERPSYRQDVDAPTTE
jgi:hypothetical protein